MREIIFRGKSEYNNEWIEGVAIVANGKAFILNNAKVVKFFGENRLDFVLQEVITETIGHFTGLFDKNGRRIFEGDILTIENEGIYAAIKYNESKAAFYVEDEDHEDYLGEAWETDVVVIGNIHDNPELLDREEL